MSGGSSPFPKGLWAVVAAELCRAFLPPAYLTFLLSSSS